MRTFRLIISALTILITCILLSQCVPKPKEIIPAKTESSSAQSPEDMGWKLEGAYKYQADSWYWTKVYSKTDQYGNSVYWTVSYTSNGPISTVAIH